MQGGERNETYNKTDAQEAAKQKRFYIGRADCSNRNHGNFDCSACTNGNRICRGRQNQSEPIKPAHGRTGGQFVFN